jgi:hypothetical protein
MKQEGKYSELGGAEVEQIDVALDAPLEASINLYDEDSAKFIDEQYEKTVSITIGFSFILLIYFFGVIFLLLSKLSSVMIYELKFFTILPRIMITTQDSNEGIRIDSGGSTKELYSKS